MYAILATLMVAIGLFAQVIAPEPLTLKRFPSGDQSTSLIARIAVVQSQLGPRLSEKAALYFPNNPSFANLTRRWSPASESDFAVVVVPGVDKDVAVTVQYVIWKNILTTDQSHPGPICG